MQRHFDSSLKDLKAKLVGMAGQVEKAIEEATDALGTRNSDRLKKVFELEEQINLAHVQIDNDCVTLLALQQPLAADLRLIVSIIKINTDLERMGDQAVNISKNTERYLKGAPIKPLVDLPIMFKEVKLMVRETIDSFVKHDETLARAVLKRDDIVDELKNKIFRDVIEVIKKDPAAIEQGLNLILIARNLERIGDHATNISEDVIFAATGEDIRHSYQSDAIKRALT
jgi:phosphate transport system protein